MIDLAFNSTLRLERFIKNNNDGSKNFDTPVNISCYKEDKITKVLTSNGEEIMSKSNYFTIDKIGENDIIDGNQVLTIEHFNMLGCEFYRSYT